MRKELKDRVHFDIIRYANCWEDADLLVEALQIRAHDRVLSIASAGDNSFALLSREPQLVVAVDVNPVQLYLCELKKAAFTLSDHTAFLEFLGFDHSTARLETYRSLRSGLTPAARQWWDAHTDIIQAGVIVAGKFEKYFGYFRSFVLPLIHSKRKIEELFRHKSSEEQERCYREQWNTWRWRFLFRIFFSRYVMGNYGRDPEFMQEVQVAVSDYIFSRAEQHLIREVAQDNAYLHHILTGTFAPRLPYYARSEQFPVIQRNLEKLVLFEGYAEDAIPRFGKFSAFNLSDIFEYLPAPTTRNIGNTLAEGAIQGARFAYWNLMVPRRLSQLLPELYDWNEALTQYAGEQDRCFFYHQFILDIRK